MEVSNESMGEGISPSIFLACVQQSETSVRESMILVQECMFLEPASMNGTCACASTWDLAQGSKNLAPRSMILVLGSRILAVESARSDAELLRS